MKRRDWSEDPVNGMRLEHGSEFKYLGLGLDESGTDEAECHSKEESGKKVEGLWLMIGVYGLSVLGSCMSHCWCLFVCMVVRP